MCLQRVTQRRGQFAGVGVGIGMPGWTQGRERESGNGKREISSLSNDPHKDLETAAVGSVLKS